MQGEQIRRFVEKEGAEEERRALVMRDDERRMLLCTVGKNSGLT